MALGIGYGLPFVAQHGTNPYKKQWAAALEGAKGAGATVEDENAGTGSCLVARGQEAYTDGLPATPSLLIVPQFYKAGNLYQDVPPFVAEDSTMRFAVSRNTTATRVNSSGLIASVASGVPRIDWLGQSCPSLLVEASGQNLALQSQDFTTTWSPTNVTVSANVTGTTDPFGTNLADEIFETAASGLHFLAQTMSITSGTTYTGTIFFKKATGSPDWVQLAFSTTGLAGFANFNLASGTVGNVFAGCTASIENYGNGWYRCRLTQTATASGTSGGPIPVFVNNTNSVTRFLTYTGNTATSIYVFGAQLETGSVATTYIPTTTAAVSRAADVISASGALVSGLIGQMEGTVYTEVDLRNWIASGRILTCSNGTSNERIIIQVGANRTLQAIVTTASADVVDISTASGQVNGVYKCALTYASGDFAFYVNGTQIGTDSSGGVPASTSVFLGKIGTSASTNFLNDRIRAAALYTTRLTDAQLAELTRL
jgi:molybdopterin-binding protein